MSVRKTDLGRQETKAHTVHPLTEDSMPRMEQTNTDAFAKAKKSNSKQNSPEETMEGTNMTEQSLEVAEQKNSPVSIAALYAEMEAEITIRSGAQVNTGVTARIRTLVGQIFDSTGKDRLLLSAVVKIVEQQEGRKKMYNLVRSVATGKSENAKYGLMTEDGRTYITRK